jgi:two-component system sensor histidine kinase UhpB
VVIGVVTGNLVHRDDGDSVIDVARESPGRGVAGEVGLTDESDARPVADRVRTGIDGLRGLLQRRWYGLPVRWQLMISISAISIGAVLLSIVLAVVDARDRIEVEVNAAMEVAHQLVNDAVARAAAAGGHPALLELVPEQLKYVRHARVLVTDNYGDLVQVAPSEQAPGANLQHARAPQWFADLVGPTVGTRQIRVMLDKNRMGAIVIAGEPRDELGEVWEEVSRRAMIWLAITALMLVLLYVILGRLLNPLVELAGGMHELEDGHYGARVATPRVHELGVIANQFNTLAEALEKARNENSRLYRNLIAVQEAERRRIANELHDEAGPCLFGITANAGSIGRLATQMPDAEAGAIQARVAEIHSITERLKSINRDLLRNLRPVELGRIPFEELIGSLVAGFERRHPECAFSLTFGDVARGYGEDVELTLFRCVQEALTNAMKHGSASRVEITIGEDDAGDGRQERALSVSIRDNGTGIVAGATLGIGITAMRERIRSIGGTSSIDSSPAGTAISIVVPLRSRLALAATGKIEETVS